jgi:hypothetical protein
MDAVHKLIESGYKTTLKWDDYNDCFGAFVIAEGRNPENTGMVLTGRGSTPLKALKQAMFKHYVVFDGSWGAWAKQRPTTEFDD